MLEQRNLPEALEKVLLNNDLSALTPTERLEFYREVCESVGLNPLTQPLAYIKLNGKLTLYALKGATDQLRSLHGVSIEAPKIDYVDDLIIVSVIARDKTGRTDADSGAVVIGTLKGEAKANAIMKAITKAKRRVTLSMCGLGMLDETEVETIPDAKAWVEPTQPEKPALAKQEKPVEDEPKLSQKRADAMLRELDKLGFDNDAALELVAQTLKKGVVSLTELTESQALEVWNIARRRPPKVKQPWEMWTEDSDAQAYGAQAKVFKSGQELMTEWAKLKDSISHTDNFYWSWWQHINELKEAERKAA